MQAMVPVPNVTAHASRREYHHRHAPLNDQTLVPMPNVANIELDDFDVVLLT